MISINWLVCDHGYRWEERDGRRVLTPVQGWPNRAYEPLLAHTGMFREFGELSLLSDRGEGFLAFANRYGPLFGDTRTELLDDWVRHTKAVQTVVVVWDSVRAGKTDPGALVNVAQAVDNAARRHVLSKFLYDPRRRRCYHDVTPLDLIGVIWLQLADAVINDREYLRCPASECGRWFARSPAGKGPLKNHCSVACKQRHYRHRKLEKS